ncbi:MAG: glycosyltransferase [Nanoarchaeota archaeon]|nr:glycosyltransferase [Nanoarchaeota archaeon]
MQKAILLGTDLHGDQSELAAKLVNDLRKEFDLRKINYKTLSIQNRKESRKEKNTLIVPRFTKLSPLRKIIQAFLLPINLLFLRTKYKNIITFWTADQKYHSYLFAFLKKIGYVINFTVISGYDKKYSALAYCDSIICQSEKMYNHLIKKFPSKNLRIIYPWANMSIFNPSKKEYDILIPSVPYKVRDFKERGMEKIIELLKTGKFKSKVIFRSQESYDYFKNSGVRNTELINKILGEKELAKIMAKAKVIPLLYSKGCPDMPLSAIEGMACGCAIITTSETGLSEIIQKNKCGAIHKEGSNLLIDLKKVLSIKEFSLNAVKFSRNNFDKKKNVKEYVKLIE